MNHERQSGSGAVRALHEFGVQHKAEGGWGGVCLDDKSPDMSEEELHCCLWLKCTVGITKRCFVQ